MWTLHKQNIISDHFLYCDDLIPPKRLDFSAEHQSLACLETSITLPSFLNTLFATSLVALLHSPWTEALEVSFEIAEVRADDDMTNRTLRYFLDENGVPRITCSALGDKVSSYTYTLTYFKADVERMLSWLLLSSDQRIIVSRIHNRPATTGQSRLRWLFFGDVEGKSYVSLLNCHLRRPELTSLLAELDEKYSLAQRRLTDWRKRQLN